MKCFTGSCFSKHAKQDSTEYRQPEQKAQKRKCHFQDYPDNKAQNKKPAMTDTAVTTCGVTIFEIR